MHHLNCFVIEAMAGALRENLCGSVLTDAYSNSPDEIIFEFGQQNIKCIFHAGELFFRFNVPDISKSRLYKPQFSDLHGLKISDVQPQRFERSFLIRFENGSVLVFKCHGRKSNIMHYAGGLFSDMFRKQLENDQSIAIAEFVDRPEPEMNGADLMQFRKACPYLPDEFLEELAKDPAQAQLSALCSRFSHLTAFDTNEQLVLKPAFGRNTVLEDINRYSNLYLRAMRFSNTHSELKFRLSKEIADVRAFIRSNRLALSAVENKRSDEETGNIILAGLHLIEAGASKALLPDIYNTGVIEIALDPKLNGVENAEKYFRKAKGVPHTLRLLNDKINKAEIRLKLLDAQVEKLDKASDWKDLKPLVQKAPGLKPEAELPFRKFNEMGYDIYVGKHAESNEKILNYYSDKDDVWLHAKDVGGSHVLIRSKKHEKLPEQVLERAAALAAYYSKNRNQSLVTVTHTLRKYVRKIKGADKGKVSVSNEKTVLVKPAL